MGIISCLGSEKKCISSQISLAGTWLVVAARGLATVVGPMECLCLLSTGLSALSGDQLEPSQHKRGDVA